MLNVKLINAPIFFAGPRIYKYYKNVYVTEIKLSDNVYTTIFIGIGLNFCKSSLENEKTLSNSDLNTVPYRRIPRE